MATTACAAYLVQSSFGERTTLESNIKRIEIKGLLPDTPSTSVRAVLVAL